MKRRGIVYGFLLAPLVPAFVFALIATIVGAVGSLFQIPLYSYAFVCLIWFLYAVVVAYPAAFIMGIPAYYVFKKYNLTSLKSFALGGVVLGALSPTLLIPVFGITAVLDFEFWIFVAASGFGVTTSTVFWYISEKTLTISCSGSA